MTCEKNAIEQNLRQTFEIIDEAVQNNIKVLCFPEMSLTGYSDPIKNPETQLTINSLEVQQLVAYTKDLNITVLIGIIEQNNDQKPFVTQLVIHEGKIISYYRKITIIEEEVLWFSPGHTIKTVNLMGLETGISICADINSENLFSEYAKQGAKLIFESSAPGLYGSQQTRNWEEGYNWWNQECKTYFGKYSKNYNLWIFVATQAGRTINEDFPGGGYVFSPTGKLLYSTSDGEPCRVYLEVDFENENVKVLSVRK